MSVLIPLVLLVCGALPLIAAAALRRPEPRRVPVRRTPR